MSLRPQIIRMAQAGNRPAVIARALNCSSQKVFDVLKAARGAGMDIPKFQRGPATLTSIYQVPHTTVKRLKPEAEKRNMTVEQLLSALAATIASDDLVEAVLGSQKP